MRSWPLALALAIPGAAFALPQTTRPQQMEPGLHGVSPPLWLMRPALIEPRGEEEENEPRRIPLTAPAAPVADAVVQRSMPALLAPATKVLFEGIGVGTVSVPGAQPFVVKLDPPDPQGDVGPNHYVQIVNSSVAVFSKTGTLLLGPVPTQTLFTGLGGTCATEGYDGIVLYDPLADRWLISQLAWSDPNKGPFWQCIAVSRTPDPTGQYAQYAYSFGNFNDYPKFGVWPDAYYGTFNMFMNATRAARLLGRRICAFDRTRMLAGEPAQQPICADVNIDEVSGLVPADFDGELPPPAGEPVSIVGFFQNDTLVVYRFHVDWQAPLENSFVDAVVIPAAPFQYLCAGARNGYCVPQLSGQPLDGLGDRIMFRVAYRNMGGYESLIANHSVAADAVGGIRWYEIRDPAGDPFVYQQGTYAPDSNSRWMGSAAMDRGGNIALGFSLSSNQQNPGIGIAARAARDPLGVMGLGEQSVPIPSTGAEANNSNRWGDYTNMSVDPADDCTFWYTAQYIPFDGEKNWRTRVIAFDLPGCSTAPDFAVWVPDNRETVRRGGAVTMKIATAALRRAAAATPIQLSVAPSPLAAGVAVDLQPASVMPGQQATLTISSDGSAAIGLVSFTVHGTAGAVTQSAEAAVAVVDHDFALSTEKPSTALGAGGNAEVRVNTSVLFGDPEVVIFSASGLPRGVQASFDPVYVRVGEPATLRLRSLPFLSPGVSNIKVTATGTLTSHTAIVRLRTLFQPLATIMNPRPYSQVSGVTRVAVTGDASPGTTLKKIELYLDGNKIPGLVAEVSPAELMWNTASADDGPHFLTARATDADGNQGSSDFVAVWIQNNGECGCSANGGGWEAIGLMALLAAIRRRRRV
jgi:hypothetical protein